MSAAPNGNGVATSDVDRVSPGRSGHSRIIRHAVVGDEGLDLALRHRLRKEIALHRRATETIDDLGLLRRFHTFHHAIEFQVAAQVDHRLDDVAGVLLRRDIANEAPVDLDLVQRQLMDIAQAGLPRSEVVKRHLQSHRSQDPERILHLLVILHQRGLGTSMMMRRGSMPLLSIRATVCRMVTCEMRSRIDRLKDRKISSGQAWAAASALRNSTCVIVPISSVRSATEMKTSGATSPSSGLCHRASASKPTSRAVPTLTIGW